MVIVDECHHLPARSFEVAVRDAQPRRWVGLTATPYRRDGLEAIITMQCGRVRHASGLAHTAAASLARRLHVHETRCTAGRGDVAATVGDGRPVLVLTQWTEHLDALAALLEHDGLAPLAPLAPTRPRR